MILGKLLRAAEKLNEWDGMEQKMAWLLIEEDGNSQVLVKDSVDWDVITGILKIQDHHETECLQ